MHRTCMEECWCGRHETKCRHDVVEFNRTVITVVLFFTERKPHSDAHEHGLRDFKLLSSCRNEVAVGECFNTHEREEVVAFWHDSKRKTLEVKVKEFFVESLCINHFLDILSEACAILFVVYLRAALICLWNVEHFFNCLSIELATSNV